MHGMSSTALSPGASAAATSGSTVSSAALEAKIASIRAKNAALEKRHQEVEQDRLSAEKRQSAVQPQNQPPAHYYPHHNNDHAHSNHHQPTSRHSAHHHRSSGSGASRGQPRREMAPKTAWRSIEPEEPDAPLRTPTGALSRLSQKEGGPPPDPAYRFLADRMRDGSDSDEADAESGWRNRTSGRGSTRGSGRGGRAPNRGAGRGSNGPSRGSSRGAQPHDSSVRHAERVHPDDRESWRAHPPQFGPDHQFDRGHPRNRGGGAAQARLDRARQSQQNGSGDGNDLRPMNQTRENGQRRVKEDNRNIKVEMKFNPSPTHEERRGSNPSSQAPRGGQMRESTGREWKNKAAPSAQTPAQWHEAEPYQPKTSLVQVTSSLGAQTNSSNTWNWRDPNAQNMGDWSDSSGTTAMMPSDPPQALDWNQHPEMSAFMELSDMSADPESQFMAMPAYPGGGGLHDASGLGGNPHLMMQYHHAQAVMAGHHQANNPYIPLPQHHQLPHHQQHGALLGHTPIMATHQFGIPGNAQASIRGQYYPPTLGGFADSGNEPGHYQGRRHFTASSRFDGPRRGNNGEISYIPQRFQKQIPTEGSKQTWNIHKAIAKLPRSSLDTPPSGCNQLLMFVSKSVAECLNAEEMSRDLKVKIKMVPVEGFDDLLGKMEEFDPVQHRYILFHVLNEDARTISQCGKSDVDKGQDSDNMADNFCDLVENLVRRITYVTAIVSMLNPRCDFEELNSMSCPNSVRKVINVQLSMRLHDKKNIVSVNNDLVLEWFKDDVKKNRLVKSNGHELTAFGISVMLEQWLTVLKEFVCEVQEVKLVDPVPVVLPSELVEAPQKSCAEQPEDVTLSLREPEPLPCSSSTECVSKEMSDSNSVPIFERVDQPAAIDTSTNQATEAKSNVHQAKNTDSLAKDEEFQEMENGGFIEDSYCDTLKANNDEERNLPSLGSITSHHDDDDDEEGDGGPTSGIFIEDSYVEATSTHGQEEILEKANQEKMEKDFSTEVQTT
ncbi:uncharacterized protein LOC131890047 isoform X2 [Tigriopus californicus]|uniref:uncharacterized protein LOC131890047 isoform X2 n=1 Tax=Tigriopus californicus TaxID=6832 RepID=UPI0027DA5A68|nr:uncharacterized protein LOC131890047 isoform X2 [Tigriopus californicus]